MDTITEVHVDISHGAPGMVGIRDVRNTGIRGEWPFIGVRHGDTLTVDYGEPPALKLVIHYGMKDWPYSAKPYIMRKPTRLYRLWEWIKMFRRL
jgi:hypothetical protein